MIKGISEHLISYRHQCASTISQCRVYKIAKTVLIYPLRFSGSKAKTGYHYSFEKEVSAKDLKGYMPYAYVNASTYNNQTKPLEDLGYSLVNPSSLSISESYGFVVKGNSFLHLESGSVVTLFSKDDRIIISVGALGASQRLVNQKELFDKHWKSGVRSGLSNLFGGVPQRYLQTRGFVNELLKNYESEKIELTGNCIGGSIASYISLKEKIPAVCINPIPLGAGIQRDIGDQQLSKADQYVTHISVKSDWASDMFLITIFDRAMSSLGIRTPGNFGHRYSVPTPFGWHVLSSHSRVMTSFKKHLNS